MCRDIAEKLKQIKELNGAEPTFESVIDLFSKIPWLGEAYYENVKLSVDPSDQLIWHTGVWEFGTWERGVWEGGIWKGGTWWNGTWEIGEWFGGTWKTGIWKLGRWEKGTWENGIWECGDWEGGTWCDGVWENGSWEIGNDAKDDYLPKRNPPNKWGVANAWLVGDVGSPEIVGHIV